MSAQRDEAVGHPRRWLLRGAAIGIAAAGGAAIVDTPQAQATSLPGIANWLNVQDYGAIGDGATDNTSAFNKALTAANSLGGTTVLVPPGTYLVNGTLEMFSGTVLTGASQTSSIIKQASTAGPLLHASGQRYMTISDLQLQGPNAGTGQGISFDGSTGAAAGLEIRNVFVVNFGGDAVYLNTAITSAFTNVRCQAKSGGYAFHAVSGTSLVFNACYANGSFKTGYYLDGVHYSSLAGCAADSTNQAYYLNNCEDITLTGCGCESNTVGAGQFGGYGFVVNGGRGNSLNGCRVLATPSRAFWATGNSVRTTFTSCTEIDAAATATTAWQVDSGSTAILIACGWGIVNGGDFASGSTYQLTPAGPV
jgi:hypothetical protein